MKPFRTIIHLHSSCTLLLAMFCVYTLALHTAFAQTTSNQPPSTDSPKWRFGAFGAALLNEHEITFRELPDAPTCCFDKYSVEQNIRWSAGMWAQYRFTPLLHAQMRVSLLSLGTRFVAVDGGFIVSTQGQSVPLLIESSLTTRVLMLGVEPGIGARFPFGLGLEGGVFAGVPIVASFEQREGIVSPADVTFKDGTRGFTRFGSISTFAPTFFSGWIGASFEFALVPQMLYVTPFVRYSIPFASLLVGDTWNVRSWQAGAQLSISEFLWK